MTYGWGAKVSGDDGLLAQIAERQISDPSAFTGRIEPDDVGSIMNEIIDGELMSEEVRTAETIARQLSDKRISDDWLRSVEAIMNRTDSTVPVEFDAGRTVHPPANARATIVIEPGMPSQG